MSEHRSSSRKLTYYLSYALAYACVVAGPLLVLWALQAGAYLICLVGAFIVCSALLHVRRGSHSPSSPHSPSTSKGASATPGKVSPRTEQGLVQSMLADKRYGLLLRQQIADEFEVDVLDDIVHVLEQEMALVPSGQVVLGAIDAVLEEGKISIDQIERQHSRVARVEPVFLDRFAVTNADYAAFVQAGGYDQITIWDEEIWPAVLDFVDQSGHPGPRFWKGGSYPPGSERLPVVGVCWYEAAAYARWIGKRLPADAEWVKAGAWPVAMAAGVWLQRKFPWGQSLGNGRANLWCAGKEGPAPVDAFEAGISVGGAYQLIGNVWEWTANRYGQADDLSLTLPVPMRSIRGGAFDTYFENQATCNFQSGENPLARKHNIGFRLALPVADLSSRVRAKLLLDPAAPEEQPQEACI